MISWRWPRPIGVIASMALMPVASGSCTDLRTITPGACSSSARRPSRGDLAEAVDRVAERVDDAAEVAVADRHREDLAGTAYRLALLDPGEVTEDDDTDLAGVEVQRDAERAVLELQQLVGHRRRQTGDAGDAVAGLGDACRPLRGWRSRACSRPRTAAARPGSPPDGSKAPSSSCPCSLRLVILDRSADSAGQPPAGVVEAAGDGAVDDVVTDLDPHATDDVGVDHAR